MGRASGKEKLDVGLTSFSTRVRRSTEVEG